jgi:GntR family transcriptional repressor for pyruvate dehydrogenase complex
MAERQKDQESLVEPLDPRTFTTVERSKVYLGIVDQILDQIKAGTYPPRSALPPERALAEQFGVSRGSLREALRVLEHAGVLDVRIGSGTYVTDRSLENATMVRARAEIVGDYSPLDLLAARRALEPVCAELAATYRSGNDLERLRNRLAEQEKLTLEGGDPSTPDREFHVAVARASRNGVLIALSEQMLDLLRQSSWADLKRRTRSHDRGAFRYLEHHKMIFSAIEEEDPVRAAQAMVMHLDSIESGLISELD